MTFCNHPAFGLEPFCKKKQILYISKKKNKQKTIKEYFNKTFEKKHVKGFILSKAADFLCKTKT